MPLDYVNHTATITKGAFEDTPSHIQCSCGVAGDFVSDADATAWVQSLHFAVLGGICVVGGVVGSSGQKVAEPLTVEEPAPAPPTPEPVPVPVEPEPVEHPTQETVGDA
jgi:hypothetical protein